MWKGLQPAASWNPDFIALFMGVPLSRLLKLCNCVQFFKLGQMSATMSNLFRNYLHLCDEFVWSIITQSVCHIDSSKHIVASFAIFGFTQWTYQVCSNPVVIIDPTVGVTYMQFYIDLYGKVVLEIFLETTMARSVIFGITYTKFAQMVILLS